MLILFKFHYLTIFTLLIVAKYSQTSADILLTLSVSPALSSTIPFLISSSSSTSSVLSTSSVTILSPTSSILSNESTTQIMTAKHSGSTAGSTSLMTNSETATRKAMTTSATIKGTTTTAETTMKGTTPETTKTNYTLPTSSIAKETTTGIQTISSTITAASTSTTAVKSTPSTSLETEKTTTTTTSKSQTETTARKTTERSTKTETIKVTSTTTTTIQTTMCVSPFLIYENAVITSTSIFLNFTSSTNVAIMNVTIHLQNMECNNDHPYIINGTDFINVTNLHPYRTYNVSVTYLDSCFDTEKTTSCSLTTLNSPPDEVDQDEIQSNSTDTEITLWWNLNNTDCMGPTFYNISYFDHVDHSTNYTLYSNSVLQTCSMNCTGYIVLVSFQNMHNDRTYSFAIFPYTNDSSSIKNGSVTVYKTQTLPVINKFSAGIIVGIVFGVLAFILLILALAYFVFKTYNNKKNTTSIYPLLWEIPENNFVTNAQTKKEILVAEFQQKINEYSDNSWFDIISEFEALNKFAQVSYKYPCESALSDANMPKNRFINVLPYDRSRVELYMPENDYINASFIKGYSGKTEYIATQGPLDVDDQVLRNKKETVPEFWLMIWQQNVTCIIMLTALHEHGRPKSACYWPTQPSNIVTYFHIEISLLEEIDYKKYVCRKFQLQQRNEKRLITHYQYLNWSDMSVIHEDDLLHFTRMIRNSENLRHKPTVVHCSAGVGRTGTFIALDILLQQIQHGFASINIYDCVLKLRQQRVLMVQVEKQYILLYKCVGKIIAEISSTSKDNTEYGNKAGTSLDDEYSFASTTF